MAQAWELAHFIQCVSLGLTGEAGWGAGADGWLGPHSPEAGRDEFLPHQPGSPSHTSKKADVVLLCGDLNMHPKDLGCRLLKEWTGLFDAYLEAQDFQVRSCFPTYSPSPTHPPPPILA